MERNCDKCIHHTSGNCDSWDCKMQTVEDVKNEAVNEYVKMVVEELEKRKQEYLVGFGIHDNNEMYGVACGLGDAIEVVKNGGVSDYVCEWNQIKGGVGLKTYKISCFGKTLEMPVSTARGLKYCPYCGEKIRMVE